MNKTCCTLEAGSISRNHRASATLAFAAIAMLIFLPLLSAPQATTHSPLDSRDNESLETATLVPEPAKSWAIYEESREEEN